MVTFFALVYVYQQSEIFRFAYAGEKRQALFQDLLDKNTALRYNILESGSLIRIGNKILESNDYEMPETYQLVKLAYPLENLKVKGSVQRKENLVARIFSIKRQAEAKTINP